MIEAAVTVPTMTPDQLAATLARIGAHLPRGEPLTPNQAARLIGADDRAVRRWVSGKLDVLPPAAALLFAMERDPTLVAALHFDFQLVEGAGTEMRQRLAWVLERDPSLDRALRDAGLMPELRVGLLGADGRPLRAQEVEAAGLDEAAFFYDGGAWMGQQYPTGEEAVAEARLQYKGDRPDGIGVRVAVWEGLDWTFVRLGRPAAARS